MRHRRQPDAQMCGGRRGQSCHCRASLGLTREPGNPVVLDARIILGAVDSREPTAVVGPERGEPENQAWTKTRPSAPVR